MPEIFNKSHEVKAQKALRGSPEQVDGRGEKQKPSEGPGGGLGTGRGEKSSQRSDLTGEGQQDTGRSGGRSIG